MVEDERPRLVDEGCRVLDNAKEADDVWLMTLSAPKIAREARPGQFVHMRVPGMEEHRLRRPFAVLDADAAKGEVDVLYQVVGHGTDHMTRISPDAAVDCIGPIGNGWSVPQGTRRALLVAGGVGCAALLMHAKALVAGGVHVDVVLGAPDEAHVVMARQFADVTGDFPQVSTDDGSFGVKGDAASLAEKALAAGSYGHVACCGPEAMMRQVAAAAGKAGAPCEVSLDRRMGCGVGTCLSCVVDLSDGRRVRACVDGPVFDAQEVVWR